jgi:16S rRNA C967 or C1407 C5-methylase (RsmB/RsmF family)/NOL1/NOP2/fmu family ribosome biogenesis protein
LLSGFDNFAIVVPSLLPKEFLSSLEGLPGFDAATFEAVHTSGDQVTSIRINPAKAKVGDNDILARSSLDAIAPLTPDGLTVTPVPWSSFGYYLETRPAFVFDPLFHAGSYYVQEASGMFLEQTLRQTADLTRPLRILDLCAAPGGKSTLLQSLITPDSLLVSNEVLRNRGHILRENMVKWGGANVVVTANDPRDFARLENYFDVIVVDAPCSGSGLFRREPEAITEWSPANVQLCSQRQQRILADCWPALREDGILIYSTCSYSKQEDEDILDWLIGELGATSERLQTEPGWNIVETSSANSGAGYRFYPDRLKGEGFFIGCVRKTGGGTWITPRRTSLPERANRKELDSLQPWLQPELSLLVFHHQQHLLALPGPLATELTVLQSTLHLKKAGITLGQLTTKEFIPAHDLAMSTLVSTQLQTLELTRDEALRYLRKDELDADPINRGWTLVQHKARNLGWIKVLPNRSNNYYPMEWRILKREPPR